MRQGSDNVRFNIAGIRFSLASEYKRHIEQLEDNYKPFLCSADEKCDLRINVTAMKNFSKPSGITSKNSVLPLSLRYGNDFRLEGDISRGLFTVEARKDFDLTGIIRVITAAVLFEKDGFLLHASGIKGGDRGYIFCGPSESGKTTIARLSGGRDVLSDETVAVRKVRNRWYAYATPFWGDLGRQDRSSRANLRAIFFIFKGAGFSHHRLRHREAVKRLIPNINLVDRDSYRMERLFDIASEAAQSVPCHDLYFKPHRSIWRYIDGIDSLLAKEK